ncbi:MAG: MFS transporter [Polyangiaceae bacterium]
MTQPKVSSTSAAVMVALATLLMAVSYLDRQVFAILAPTLTRELAIDDATYGWLAATFSFAYLVAPPFAGALLDRTGVRVGLPLAVVAWSVVAALHAGVSGVVMLFGLRFLLGLAESPSFPGAARVVREVVAPASRSRAFGVLFTGSSLGAIIAPRLATAMFSSFGWRFTFVGTALVGLLWIPAFTLAARRSPVRDVLDAARAEPAASGGFVTAIRTPAVWRSTAIIVAAAPVAAFSLLWGAKMLVGRFGIAQKDVGTYLWLPPLVFDVGAIVFGDLASRLRARSPAWVALPFGVAALLSVAVALVVTTRDPWAAVAFVGVAMAGVGGVFAIQTAVLLERMPPALASVAAGINAGAQSLAYIVASAIVGRVVSRTGGYDAALVGLGLWAIPGALVWLVWPRFFRDEGER